MNPYLLLLVGIIAMSIYLWRQRDLFKFAWKLNGEMGYPIIGSAYLFLDATKVVNNMSYYGGKYGNMCGLWLGSRLFLYIDNPADVETVLNSQMCINKGDSYHFLKPFIGESLITSRDDEWRTHRKLLNPSFSYQIINKFVPTFNRHIRILVEQLEKRCDGQTFDILTLVQLCSLDMISETTMDRLINAQLGYNNKYVSAIHECLEVAGIRMFNPFLQPDPIFNVTSLQKSQAKSIEVIKGYVNTLIETKSKCIEEVLSSKQQNDGTMFGKTKNIFIDHCLKLVKQDKLFSLVDVENETNGVLFAGYETTASTLANICLMLAMHPEYQERVYEESKTVVLVSEVEDITNEHLAQLKYLDMFIKETMRLFPSVPYLTRTTTTPIEVGGMTVPPGVEIVISAFDMQRSKEIYKNPDVFNPDNFLPSLISQRHPYSYVPFSSGPRGCIGMRYANIVVRMLTVYLVQNYRLSTKLKIEDLKFRMNVSLNLLNKHLVSVEKRNTSRVVIENMNLLP